MKRKGIAVFIIFTMLFSIHITVSADNNTSFSDIKNHWSTEYIALLTEKGIISGYPDGTFRPDNSVTRAEAVKMIIVATGEDVGSYKDGYWATNYIEEAIKLEYILENEFEDYSKVITRGELARVIVRALDEEYPENINEYSKLITDYDNINNNDRDHIIKAYIKGIITGYPDGAFNPGNNVTRAEASTMLVRFLEPEKRIIPELDEEKKEESEPIEEEPSSNFIVPKFIVENHEHKDVYAYYTIYVVNYEDYIGHDEYTFVTECTSHPEINNTKIRDIFEGGYIETDQVKNQTKTGDRLRKNGGIIYKLKGPLEYWWVLETGEHFNPEENEKISYKVTVTNTETGESQVYEIDANFKDKVFEID